MGPDELRTLDEIAGDATPAAVEEDIAGWRCKADPDLPFRRANVARPPVGAGRDPAEAGRALAVVRAWCHEHGRRLIVQVSSADPDADALDALLAAEGLEVEAPVHLMVADLADLTAAANRSSAPNLVDPPAPSPAIDRVVGIGPVIDQVAGTGPAQASRAAAYRRMLEPRGDRALVATVADEAGATVGLGFGVLDRGWLGIFGMVTSPAHRRGGIASAIVRALAVEAAARGATRAYLQVETDNAPAIACYEGLGFAISHGYHYRSEAPDPDQGC